MKHWFKDQHFRSLLKNTSYLAMSRVVAAVCSLATLAFAGRVLGVILFGTLILITSYAKAASGIAKFQSWQLVVRYGGHGIAHGRSRRLQDGDRLCFRARRASAASLGMIARGRASALHRQLGRDQAAEYLWLAMLYCTAASDHGRGDARRRASSARPVRPDQLVGHGDPDRPSDPRRCGVPD